MDLAIIMSLVSMNIVTFTFLLLAVWLDKEGIINQLKLKLQKGSGLIIIIGKDKKLYMTVSKIAGKKSDTEQIEVNGLPYTLNKNKIIFHKTSPCLMYDEGVSEPLSVVSGELNYGKLTPELLSQMLAMARQSGRLPQAQDKREQLMFFLTIGSMLASATAVFLIFNMDTSLQNISQVGKATLEAVKTLAGV